MIDRLQEYTAYDSVSGEVLFLSNMQPSVVDAFLADSPGLALYEGVVDKKTHWLDTLTTPPTPRLMQAMLPEFTSVADPDGSTLLTVTEIPIGSEVEFMVQGEDDGSARYLVDDGILNLNVLESGDFTLKIRSPTYTEFSLDLSL